MQTPFHPACAHGGLFKSARSGFGHRPRTRHERTERKWSEHARSHCGRPLLHKFYTLRRYQAADHCQQCRRGDKDWRVKIKTARQWQQQNWTRQNALIYVFLFLFVAPEIWRLRAKSSPRCVQFRRDRRPPQVRCAALRCAPAPSQLGRRRVFFWFFSSRPRARFIIASTPRARLKLNKRRARNAQQRDDRDGGGAAAAAVVVGR